YTSLPLFHGNALGVTALGAIVLDYKLALGERFETGGFYRQDVGSQSSWLYRLQRSVMIDRVKGGELCKR
ncbi:MAG TPA: hypothetical protein VKB35_04810, partial [Ktedonobacteraceae bacterium]|nr:hypothetical protein [Ktedonobacteraceae bacterium]